MLDVRYGNKRIELAPKKPTIELGDTENLVPTLETIKEAVIAGELDRQLAASKQHRKRLKMQYPFCPQPPHASKHLLRGEQLCSIG